MGAVPVTVPEVLRHAVAGEDGGGQWLAALDDLVGRAVQRWSLEVGEPFRSGMAAWTAPATTADGTAVVVKLSFPHDEAWAEAAALAAWDGAGAVRLLDADQDDQALLSHRVAPGSSLRDVALPIRQHLEVGAEVMRRLATVDVPAGEPFRNLSDVAAELAVATDARLARLVPSAPYPVDVGVCRRAIELLGALSDSAEQKRLAHGDLNPGNVLRQVRAGAGGGSATDEWLAIDPKPVHGDLAWDPWPLLTQVDGWLRAVPAAEDLADRARVVADATGLDAARIAMWCTARGVASGLWAADQGWWTGFRGADSDLDRAGAWAGAVELLGG